jgi:hypothetical protein
VIFESRFSKTRSSMEILNAFAIKIAVKAAGLHAHSYIR